LRLRKFCSEYVKDKNAKNIPTFLAALFFTVAGFAMQKAVPQAHSIGEVWHLTLGK